MRTVAASLQGLRTRCRSARYSAAVCQWRLAPGVLGARPEQRIHQQHRADQKLPEKDCEGYTLLLALRSWEFAAFAAMRR